MNGRSRVLAAAAAAGIAVLAWALLPRASAPEADTASGDGPRGTAPPPPVVGTPGLHRREEEPPKPLDKSSEAETARNRRITGTVTDLNGKPIAGCLVWTPWFPQIPPIRTDAKGGFALAVPDELDLTEHPLTTTVRIVANGFAAVERSFTSSRRLELGATRLGGGPVLTGTVVDRAERAVAGFTVVLRKLGITSFPRLANYRSGYAVGPEDPLAEADSEIVGLAVSDRDGKFEILGTTWNPERASGHGEGWVIVKEEDVGLGRDNRLVAVPAAVTTIRLEFPKNAATPGEWELRLGEDQRGGEGLTVHSPSTTIWWSRAEGFPREVHAEIAVQVDGYEPMRQEVVIPADVTRKDVEFRLRPAAADDDATVVFTLVTDDAEFAKRPFDLEIHDADRQKVQVSYVSAETFADGRIRAKAPPGRWWLRLRPGDGWCNPLYWEGEQRLASRRENPIVWNVPAHGGARLLLPGRKPDDEREIDGTVTVYPATGGVGAAFPLGLLGKYGEAKDHLRVQALPVGAWRVELDVAERDGMKESTTNFTVRAGEVADVVLEKPVRR